MTVAIAAPALQGIVGAIDCIRKLRLDSPSIFGASGASDVYFILTSARRLYYTLDIAVAPVEISLLGIPFLATATLTDMSVYAADNGGASHTKYPVVLLYGSESTGLAYDAGVTPIHAFTATVMCGGLPSLPPAISIGWPGVMLAEKGSGSSVDFIGYRGPEEPDNYVGFSAGMGVHVGPFSQVSSHSLAYTQGIAYAPVQVGDMSPWTVRLPTVNIVTGTEFTRLETPAGASTGLTLSGDSMTVAPYTLVREVRQDGSTSLGRLRLMYTWAMYDETNPAGAQSIMYLQEATAGAIHNYAASLMGPIPCPSPMSQADTEWLATQTDVRHVAQGWGLSGLDEPVPGLFTQRIHGSESIVFVTGSNSIRVCGDGAGTTTLLTPAGAYDIKAIACGHVGLLDDIDTTRSKASIPLYRGGVVALAGRYVMYSNDALNWLATPVLVLPVMAGNEVLTAGLRFYPYTTPSASIGNRLGKWVLSVIYRSGTAGTLDHIFCETYASADGQTWVLQRSDDATAKAILQSDGVLGASGTDTIELANMVARYGASTSMVSCRLYMSPDMLLSSLYFDRKDGAGVTIASVAIRVRYFNGEGYGWEIVATLGPANPGGLRGQVHQGASGVYTVGGDGAVTYLAYNAWNETTYLLPPTPNYSTASPPGFGFADSPEWNTPEAHAVMAASGFTADTVVPMEVAYVSGTGLSLARKPIFMKNTNHGILAAFAAYPPGMATSDIRAMSVVEEVKGGLSGTSWVLPGYSFAFFHTDPARGTIAFLRNPSGDITHVGFSSTSIALTLNKPAPLGACGFAEFVFIHPNISFVDIFAYSDSTAGSAITLYLTDTDGRIWFASNGASLTLRSGYFLGRKNLRIANAGGMWVATYDGLDAASQFVNTCVEYSMDFRTWNIGVGVGESAAPGMVSRAYDILPLGSTGGVELGIPASGTDPASIFISQIP